MLRQLYSPTPPPSTEVLEGFEEAPEAYLFEAPSQRGGWGVFIIIL